MQTAVAEIPATQMLPVPLTEEEKESYTKTALDNRARVVALEDEKKAYNKTNKEAQDAANVRMDDAMDVLRRGTITKEVECKEVRNYTTGSVVVVRLDTGEIVSQRDMKLEERQEALKFAPTMSLAERNQAILDAEWAAWGEAEAERERQEFMAQAEEAGAIPISRGKVA